MSVRNSSNYMVSLVAFGAGLLLVAVGMVFVASFFYTSAQTGGHDCITIFGLATLLFFIGYGYRKRSCSVCRGDLTEKNKVMEIEAAVCRYCYDKHFCKERIRQN